MVHFLQDNANSHIKKSNANSNNVAQKKTLTRTRKFVIDGVVVTTTTSKVIYGDSDKLKDDHVLRYVARAYSPFSLQILAPCLVHSSRCGLSQCEFVYFYL